MKKKTIGGVRREWAMYAAGYCLGLSTRKSLNLDKTDRKMLRTASKALRAACKELWPEWFKQ